MVIGKIVILLRAFSATAFWRGSLGAFLADDLIHQRDKPAGVFWRARPQVADDLIHQRG
jgi:hypothetical protein